MTFSSELRKKAASKSRSGEKLVYHLLVEVKARSEMSDSLFIFQSSYYLSEFE